MKNIFKSFGLASVVVLFFSACTNTPHNYEYEVYEQYDTSVTDTLMASSVYVSYPKFVTRGGSYFSYKTINKLIKEQVLSPFDSEKDFSNDFFNRRKEIVDSFDINSMPWEYSISTKILVNGLKHISTMQSNYNFEGGAHGMSNIMLTNYSLETGDIILLEDVISDTTSLKTYLTEAFIEQHQLNSNKPFDEQGYFVESDMLPLTYEFAIMPEGIMFMYNQYEIAPYASGIIQVLVPYIDLKDILIYQADWDKAEVFPLYLED